MGIFIEMMENLTNYHTATIVRLLTINLINAYTTSWILYLSGGSGDPRLLLPAWICIASVRAVTWYSSAFSDHNTDTNISLPLDSSTTCDTEGDFLVDFCFFNRKFH